MEIKFCWRLIFEILIKFINHPYSKFGPDCFDVYWIQTYQQTSKVHIKIGMWHFYKSRNNIYIPFQMNILSIDKSNLCMKYFKSIDFIWILDSGLTLLCVDELNSDLMFLWAFTPLFILFNDFYFFIFNVYIYCLYF